MAVQDYETSTDYEKLYDLCAAGQRVVCFVTYDFRRGQDPEPLMAQDICTAKKIDDVFQKEGFFIIVGCRGLTFIDTSFGHSKEYFTDMCKGYNLEYIMPKVQE